MKIKYLKLLFIILLGGSVSSCAQLDPVTPTSYHFLLVKINDILSLCCLLLNQQEAFHGQVIGRLYYGYYHLARLLHINLKDFDAGGHTKTWKKLPNNIRDFGFRMKELREKYDYDVDDLFDLSENLDNDFKKILADKIYADSLLNELNNTLEHCCYLQPEDIVICRKDIESIKERHQQLIQQIIERNK